MRGVIDPLVEVAAESIEDRHVIAYNRRQDLRQQIEGRGRGEEIAATLEHDVSPRRIARPVDPVTTP
jgi:hypothetical protein